MPAPPVTVAKVGMGAEVLLVKDGDVGAVPALVDAAVAEDTLEVMSTEEAQLDDAGAARADEVAGTGEEAGPNPGVDTEITVAEADADAGCAAAHEQTARAEEETWMADCIPQEPTTQFRAEDRMASD
ncbi:uncharacterized protein BP5553_02401 [Venustampulla echinocandica]|uniref:Uncharacterized protein n=1 Tax=Venustampulla echinocandica TaxID=2656787 RepID=A0A370U3S5_9HELO|nr:uncharacterized protein BP5553_02401 [Venustampulla echinocandica]RDL42422.1 hypothetical protein BP5553_02401 [Venustampulla echinocandica]